MTNGESSFSLGDSYSSMLSEFSFTPILIGSDGYTQYFVKVTGFMVGETSVSDGSDFNVNPTVVDSGTSLLYVPSATYSQIVADKYIAEALSYSGECSNIDVSNYPSLSIQFENTGFLSIPPSAYISKYGRGSCLNVLSLGSEPFGPLMGDVFMQNFNVFYDIANLRIGFASQSTCPSGGVQVLMNIPLILLLAVLCLINC